MFLKNKIFLKNVKFPLKCVSSLKWEEPEPVLKITAGAGAASFLAASDSLAQIISFSLIIFYLFSNVYNFK